MTPPAPDDPSQIALMQRIEDLTRRVVELEIRSAYQEELISKLDDVVLEFTDRTAALARTVTELEQRLAAATESGDIGPPDEAPPHY